MKICKEQTKRKKEQTKRKEGKMEELVEKNYFSKENNMKYCGSSQIKAFLECEAKALAELNGEWEEEKSKSLLIGSYVDAAMSGTLEEFKAETPELFKKDGTLKAEYIQAQSIFERTQQDEMFKKYISGDHQQIFTGTLAGVPIKIKIDSYHKNKALVDLKVIRDFQPIWSEETHEKENFVDYYKYTWQAALYQEIVRQNTGKQLPFFIAAITKEVEPDLAILNIPQEVLDTKLEIIKGILPRIQELKQGKVEPIRCEHCDYCRRTKKITQIIDYRDL